MGALVKWLWEETHVPNVVSSNPGTIYWMDIFHKVFVVKFVFEKPKSNEKRPGLAHFLKIMPNLIKANP